MIGSFQHPVLLWHPSLFHLHVYTICNGCMHTQSTLKILKERGSLNTTRHFFFQIYYFAPIEEELLYFIQVGFSFGIMETKYHRCTLKVTHISAVGQGLSTQIILLTWNIYNMSSVRFTPMPSTTGALCPLSR